MGLVVFWSGGDENWDKNRMLEYERRILGRGSKKTKVVMNMIEERPWRYIKDCKWSKRQREREDLSDKDGESNNRQEGKG